MICLKIEPHKKPYTIDIENTLDNLQNEVCGYIQVIYPFEDRVAIVCDDEGKLKGYDANRVLYNDDGEISDVIAGTFLVVGLSDEDFADLSEELVDKYSKRFDAIEEFYRTPAGIVMLDGKDIHFVS